MTPNLRTLGAALLLLAGAAQAEPRHAITLYDEPPKYPANFQHFDYVNPDAPKGGTLRQQSVGGFDSFNPFIPKGNAVGVGLIQISIYITPRMPAFWATLLIFLSQLGTGLVLDFALTGAFGVTKLLGGLLVLLGLCHYAWVGRRDARNASATARVEREG